MAACKSLPQLLNFLAFELSSLQQKTCYRVDCLSFWWVRSSISLMQVTHDPSKIWSSFDGLEVLWKDGVQSPETEKPWVACRTPQGYGGQKKRGRHANAHAPPNESLLS
mmetsp:Transcript_55379/g.140022  ORF Transcript_55379/g.140022 Transcript_55379/m.140022 type:complete len:109 (-) Transcript_55379:168-494(-)